MVGLHNETKRAQWLSLVEEQERSGLGQKEFCQEKQISLNTFSYYRGQYLKRQQRPEKPSGEKFPPFVELSLPSMPVEPFRLSFPNGISLTLPHHFDHQQLKKLVEVLRVC